MMDDRTSATGPGQAANDAGEFDIVLPLHNRIVTVTLANEDSDLLHATPQDRIVRAASVSKGLLPPLQSLGSTSAIEGDFNALSRNLPKGLERLQGILTLIFASVEDDSAKLLDSVVDARTRVRNLQRIQSESIPFSDLAFAGIVGFFDAAINLRSSLLGLAVIDDPTALNLTFSSVMWATSIEPKKDIPPLLDDFMDSVGADFGPPSSDHFINGIREGTHAIEKLILSDTSDEQAQLLTALHPSMVRLLMRARVLGGNCRELSSSQGDWIEAADFAASVRSQVSELAAA